MAPVIMLLPYSKDPDTGSRMPSISTGGAATKAKMKTVVAHKLHTRAQTEDGRGAAQPVSDVLAERNLSS
jgi:hypothetical protein